MLAKFWEFIKIKQSEIVLAVTVILIAVIAFESGKISALHHFGKPLEIKYEQANLSQAKPPTKLDFQVVASKNSTSQLYHFLWCSGAKRIKEENKITFSSEQEAQSKGYTLASNCQK